MGKLIRPVALTGAMSPAALASAQTGNVNPTIVLVHGAFAESASWNGMVAELACDGYPVVAAASPVRSVSSDAVYVASVVRAVPRPVILVGHSYAGAVISAAGDKAPNVKALVYVT